MAIEMYHPANRFDNEQLEKLNQPLQATRIKERKGGSSKLLKYLKCDDVIGVANDIFGYGRWGYKVIARDHQVVEDPKKGGPIHMYTADIDLSVVGCPFSFTGDGVGVVNDPYTVEMHEKARKEATSDALKRALRHYGDQFGLCLYNQEDMVETSDGTRVKVKDVKVGGEKQPQGKRVVDATKPVLANDIKLRLNKLYPDAKVLKLFDLGKNEQEALANFFKLMSTLIGEHIANPTQVTTKHLDTVEAHISQVIEARQQRPVEQAVS